MHFYIVLHLSFDAKLCYHVQKKQLWVVSSLVLVSSMWAIYLHFLPNTLSDGRMTQSIGLTNLITINFTAPSSSNRFSEQQDIWRFSLIRWLIKWEILTGTFSNLSKLIVYTFSAITVTLHEHLLHIPSGIPMTRLRVFSMKPQISNSLSLYFPLLSSPYPILLPSFSVVQYSTLSTVGRFWTLDSALKVQRATNWAIKNSFILED